MGLDTTYGAPAGLSWVRNLPGRRVFFGREAVVVHDVDRERAWISFEDGLPLIVSVPLSQIRVEQD